MIGPCRKRLKVARNDSHFKDFEKVPPEVPECRLSNPTYLWLALILFPSFRFFWSLPICSTANSSPRRGRFGNPLCLGKQAPENHKMCHLKTQQREVVVLARVSILSQFIAIPVNYTSPSWSLGFRSLKRELSKYHQNTYYRLQQYAGFIILKIILVFGE